MPDVKLRPIRYEDLSICEAILKTPETTCFTGEYPTVDYLSHIMIDKLSFVATIDNDIVGCIFSEKLKCFGALLNFMAVREDCRSKGIGKKLLFLLQSMYKSEGIEWMVLYSSIKSDRNKSFYEKNGFTNNNGFYEFGKLIM
jgi:Acetyltransferases